MPKNSLFAYGFKLALQLAEKDVEQKGIHHLIDALAPIAQPLDIHLDIIGTGKLEQQLKLQAKEQGLTHNVTFLGAKPHEWVKEKLSNYDCLIAPFFFSETGGWIQDHSF